MEKVITYGNGLRLIVENMPSFRSVAAGIWVRAGSSNENKDNNGISHFIEHMMFKGTDKLSAFEIANSFEKLGASINAFTGKECTCYYFKSISENFDKCMELLTGIFFDSIFKKEELERERKVIIEEINMTEDSIEDICYDLISRSCYGNHSLGQTILGPKENILRFEKSDIEKYLLEYYIPNNIVISMAGNISLDDADKIVRKLIIPKLKDNKKNIAEIKTNEITQNVLLRIKDFEQSNIAVGFPSLRFNDSKFAVQTLLNLIVGGGMSSRLFQRIREEQGLAYSVYSAPSSFTSNGTFNIYLNISEKNTEKALLSTFSELKKLIKNGVSSEEFTKSKTQIKAASVFAEENLQTVMMSLGKLMTLTGEVYDIDKRIAQYNSVTKEELEEFINKTFITNNLNLAYVGKQTSADLYKIVKDY